MSIRYMYFKRIFDLTLSFIALIAMLPILVIIALIILVMDGYPIIHLSDRIGFNGKLFKMPKFRTMKLNTPISASDLLVNPSVYVTHLGSFLRRTSLDELPQLWSILIGDMSIVGPRPALYNQYSLLIMRNEFGIDQIKPGLTGMAQISGRDNLSDVVKVQYDAKYFKEMSLYLDLKIIGLTIYKVFFDKNISH